MHADTSWDPDAFAAALADLATAYAYTHEDMARRARVHRSQISRWSTGRHRPSYEALDALLAAASVEDDKRRGILAAAARAAGYQRLADIYSDREPTTTPDDEPTDRRPTPSDVVAERTVYARNGAELTEITIEHGGYTVKIGLMLRGLDEAGRQRAISEGIEYALRQIPEDQD